MKKACKIQSGSGVPNKTKVATVSKADLQTIAEQKMPDLNKYVNEKTEVSVGDELEQVDLISKLINYGYGGDTVTALGDY